VASDPKQFLQRTLLGEAVDLLDEAAVFVWNEERHYVAVNEYAAELVGLSRDELLGVPVGDLTEDHAAADIERTQAAPVLTGHSSFTRRDGVVVELDWVTMHTRIAGLPYMVSVCWRRPTR
jgi:PAS domain S-box-containing protein